MMLNNSVRTADFLQSESLHDGIVLDSVWEDVDGPVERRLVIGVQFYIDMPEMKAFSLLKIYFDGITTTDSPWTDFDMYYLDLISEAPLTFSTQDMTTGTVLNFTCNKSYIVIDETFLDYLDRYDRPAAKQLHCQTSN